MKKTTRWLVLIGLALTLAGIGWLYRNSSQSERYCTSCHPAAELELPLSYSDGPLASGMAISMDSSIFDYSSRDWQISELGADPSEPADPWIEPSGVVAFNYVGEELALQIATGNYWGYMLVTVDNEPANLLPAYSVGVSQMPAGYKAFYEPERTSTDDDNTLTPSELVPTGRWLRVHQSANNNSVEHTVRIELWRSWGQVPLRGVAVDRLPPEPRPLWPGILLVIAGLGLLAPLLVLSDAFHRTGRYTANFKLFASGRAISTKLLGWLAPPVVYWSVTSIGVAGIGIGVAAQEWIITLVSLALLALTSLVSLVPWLAALLFGLPFYFGIALPILPNRSLGLLDVGVGGGLVLLILHNIVGLRSNSGAAVNGSGCINQETYSRLITLLLTLLVGWSLVSAFAADYIAVALREWRMVFLYGGLFAAILSLTVLYSNSPKQVRRTLFCAWLMGGTAVAVIGLWQYFSGSMLISAEGVNRIRGLYGSPNNLALYLDRTLAVTLALALLVKAARWVWWTAAFVQLAALILTFSKGAIFLGLPAMLVTLATVAIFASLGPQSRRKILFWLGGFAFVGIVALIPFLSTERFQQLLDFSQGTSFLRLQLWRSSWQMALDHLLLGVGPDNFLYSYRSDYILPLAWQEPDLNHPHNWILDWWTRLGIPGLTLGLLFWGVGLWRMIRGLLQTTEIEGFDYALRVGSVAAMVAALAHGLIDVSYALPDLMLVWVFLIFQQGQD